MTSAAFHDDEGVLEKKGFGPFTTRVVWRKFTGEIEVIESRRQRKHTTNEAERTWWAPRSRSWWIGVLFAIGSACFAAAAVWRPPWKLTTPLTCAPVRASSITPVPPKQ